MLTRLSVLLGAVSAVSSRTVPEKRLDNGVGRTPALGWNSWNQGGCKAATAAVVLNTAQAFIDLGLKDLGYTYVNIDDCWSLGQRNSSGHLVADPAKFPQGIDGLARAVHAKGLKLGLYGDAGTLTCALYPGSYGSEQKDADTIAAWGVDYWKFDNCLTEQVYTNKGIKSPQYYPIMRDALLKTGKPILFSLCQWGRDEVWTWGGKVGNSWRMSEDITNDWASVASIAARAATMHEYAAPGEFNDLDMMELGNGVLTEAEERAHFGLWAIMKSPIIMGTDMTKLKESTLKVIKNKGILAINQDPLGKAATTFTPKGQAGPVSGKLYKYFAGPLSDGVVVGLVAADGAATLSVNFSDVPGLGEGSFEWTELYSGKTGTGTSVSQQLGAHDMAVFKVVTKK
ncbi:glycoside hydrolase superfamily [Chaetomium tenue]|uniref:Glycoside hydrolase superfamily n=1 Tax=Chaetomium tenue TaxID=1854479 RepID=A0ACB7P6W2_9PEZI|nr:glycoside hydrolase superfamily [Chaetomium globosum]